MYESVGKVISVELYVFVIPLQSADLILHAFLHEQEEPFAHVDGTCFLLDHPRRGCVSAVLLLIASCEQPHKQLGDTNSIQNFLMNFPRFWSLPRIADYAQLLEELSYSSYKFTICLTKAVPKECANFTQTQLDLT